MTCWSLEMPLTTLQMTSPGWRLEQVLGYFGKGELVGQRGDNFEASRRRLVLFVAYMITIVWVISFLVDIISKSYEPHPGVHAAMTILIGGLMADGLIVRKSPDKSDEDVPNGRT